MTVRQGTVQLRRRIGELDGQMGQVGRSLTEKKREVLQQRKVANNIDEAIEALQTALRLLDLINRVREMIKSGKYFAALRALEDLQSLPPSSISQTPLYEHILSSLPSLQKEIKSAVTATEKNWLLDVRQASGQVGKLALDQMESRTRKWKSKQERDPGLRHMQVGGAVELVNHEKVECEWMCSYLRFVFFPRPKSISQDRPVTNTMISLSPSYVTMTTVDPLSNDHIQLDFKPLLQCIHIYDALNCRPELQQSYQEDRQRQSSLILSQRSVTTPQSITTTFPLLLQELIGFFIIEQNVLRITKDFRSQRQVNSLWDEVCRNVVQLVSDSLKTCEDPKVFLQTKWQILNFEQTLKVSFEKTHLSHICCCMSLGLFLRADAFFAFITVAALPDIRV